VSWNSTRLLSARFYHPELDVLRFFAFFMVFLHHALPHDPAFWAKMGVAPSLASLLCAIGATGAFGVNLFFLLSSYLITELLIRERARFGHIDLKSFYIRRILRIWPLYFAFLALAWVMQWYVPGQHIGWRAGLAFSLLGGNWWLVFVGFPSSVIFPLWSVSIEEQFYIFWPATMRKLSQRGLLIAAGLMLAVANFTRWYVASRHAWESQIWGNTFVQLDAIALGVLLAVLLAGAAPRITPLPRIALFTGGLACLVLAGNYFQIKGDPLTFSRVLLGYPVMALGAVALFLATLRDLAPAACSAALPDAARPSRGAGGPHPPAFSAASGAPHLPPSAEVGLRNSGLATIERPQAEQPSLLRTKRPPSRTWSIWELSPLVYLGRISYGLYVFHILGLMISDYTVTHQGSSLGRFLFRDTVGFAFTVALSAISYRWLETPFLTLKQRFTHVLSRPGG
jgi:peptidoglycan/LPS O-acetylase OafA/YrhL